MTSSTILINFPFPLSQYNSAVVKVNHETKIFEIIKNCLVIQSHPEISPCDYCLLIHPQDAVLLPFVSVSDYRKSFFINDQVSFYLIPKMYFTVRLNVISVQVTTICDGNQKIHNLVSQVKNASQAAKASPIPLQSIKSLSLINSSYISEPLSLESFIKGVKVDINTSMNEILHRNAYKTPVITVKRQAPSSNVQGGQACPVFKGNIGTALARENNETKVPYFLTKIFELVEQKRDTLGIYRKSGDFTTIESISKEIDATIDKDKLSSYLEQQDPHDLACTVKLYLRQLSEAVIPPYLANDFYSVLHAGEGTSQLGFSGPNLSAGITNFSYSENGTKDVDIDEEMVKFKRSRFRTLPTNSVSPNDIQSSDQSNINQKLSILKSLLCALPTPNYDLFQALCQHLEKIVDASNNNQMNYQNLSICIGTNMIRVAQGLDTVKETANAQSVCQLIFENWHELFTSQVTPQFTNEFTVTKSTTAVAYNNISAARIASQSSAPLLEHILNAPKLPQVQPPVPAREAGLPQHRREKSGNFYNLPGMPPRSSANQSRSISTNSSETFIGQFSSQTSITSQESNGSNDITSPNLQNTQNQQQKPLIQQGTIVTVLDKNGGMLEGMIGPAWIINYNNAQYKVDSYFLAPIKIDSSLVFPEPTEIAPLCPLGNVSLKKLAEREYLMPDEQASPVALNGPDACDTAGRLKAIEGQLDLAISEYNRCRSPEACAKLKRLMRQLSAF